MVGRKISDLKGCVINLLRPRSFNGLRTEVDAYDLVGERRKMVDLQTFTTPNFQNGTKTDSDSLPDNASRFPKSKLLFRHVKSPRISQTI